MILPSALRITFDSNVWENVIDVDKYARTCKENDLSFDAHLNQCYKSLHDAVVCKRIVLCVAETIFTLEAIPKIKRKEVLSRPPLFESKTNDMNGRMEIHCGISPDKPVETNDRLRMYLELMRKIGGKVMYTPRIGLSRSDCLVDSDFLPDYFYSAYDRNERFGKYGRFIEQKLKGGKSKLDDLLDSTASHQKSHGIIEKLQNSNATPKKIATAVAEWADGDLIAAHLAYGNYAICTLDGGKNAGETSIFHPNNIKGLKELRIMTPQELVKDLELL